MIQQFIKVMDLILVFEQISQMINFDFNYIVPAHKNFLSLLKVIAEISGEFDSSSSPSTAINSLKKNYHCRNNICYKIW